MSLHHAVLGLLSTSAMNADEVVHHFERSIGQFWTAERCEVTRTLSRVLEAGLVSTDLPSSEGPTSGATYRLTPRGRGVLRDWMTSEPEIYPNRAAFLLRLYFAAALDAGQVSALLEARIASLSIGLAMLQAMAGQASHGAETTLADALALATVDNGIAHAQAEIDWALEWRDRMTQWQADVDSRSDLPPAAATG